MIREVMDHFLAIVDSMADEDRTIHATQSRLKDEGLTPCESNTVIKAWMALYGNNVGTVNAAA
jgi:hypothetical protein